MDYDLAALYDVKTKILKQTVKRHAERFPNDFMFQLTKEETKFLLSQTTGRASVHGGLRYQPFAFTEQGVAMLSSVLNRPRAIAVNIQIMRTFVRFREVAQENETLRQRLDAIEKTYDENFQIIFRAMRENMKEKEENPPEEIGFKPSE